MSSSGQSKTMRTKIHTVDLSTTKSMLFFLSQTIFCQTLTKGKAHETTAKDHE